MDKGFLTSHVLAHRWNIQPATLRQWRWIGKGPVYLKIGSRVLYRLEDIEKFEETRLRQHTSMHDCQSPY